MPNVLLTQRCVRSCPYCFADKHMSGAPDEHLSWENLIYLADFLKAGGERRFAILGGEPALHPSFASMVAYVLERGFDVTVFTSGIWADRTLEEASELLLPVPHEKLSFVCNLNDPAQTPTSLAETESVKRFLRAFGDRTVPGFNIYRPDFELEFLFCAINEFGLKRHIRLGLAHPIPGKQNRCIALAELDQVIARLFSYAPQFERLRVKPGLDCGFPMCRFSEEQLGWLYRHTGGKSEFGCGPVVDIGPDMSVWSCFPLSGFRQRSLFEFNTLKEIHDHYEHLHQSIRTEVGGIFEECDSCLHREDGICRGGCVSHSVARFQQEHRLRMKEVYP